jgi:hypothetical protein
MVLPVLLEDAGDGEDELRVLALGGVVGEDEVIEDVVELEQGSEGVFEVEWMDRNVGAVEDFRLDGAYFREGVVPLAALCGLFQFCSVAEVPQTHGSIKWTTYNCLSRPYLALCL